MINLEDIIDIDEQTRKNNEVMRKTLDFILGESEKSAPPEKVCANCGMAIEGNYFKVGDNFLQVKYFDDEDTENVFCSKDCLCQSLSVLEIDKNGEAFTV